MVSANSSAMGIVHADIDEGKVRFWFWISCQKTKDPIVLRQWSQ